MALTAAYVLAGELHAADGDHGTAYPVYERRLRGHVAASQAVLEPTTRYDGDGRDRPRDGTAVGPEPEAALRAATAFDLPDY
ncbi:hypothetical protein AB0D10_05825 [Kitasatospora sp. NPDC048545]|uniref:hypothetical protein n=1 Tax=Kitasatospora sp. NPDC048545 TaxID=3157208 RepID=UPI0033E8760A